jgi:hypothetical protein
MMVLIRLRLMEKAYKVDAFIFLIVLAANM